MLDITKIKPKQKIRFNVTEGDYNTFWHFSPRGDYTLYELKDVYPNAKLSNPNELIIWCDEMDIHYVTNLNPEEWDDVIE